MNKKKHQSIDGLEMMQSLYGTPKKRFKRKAEDAKKRPKMNWKNRKTKP